jgi:uncharacterized protein with PQ loop repeat
MLTTTEIGGFAGAGLAGAAYIPQIAHLVRARCSAGISRLAFEVWLLASLLITARAIAIHAGVFIVLGGIQIVATTVIIIYATRYKNTACPIHDPRQPGPPLQRPILFIGTPFAWGRNLRTGEPAATPRRISTRSGSPPGSPHSGPAGHRPRGTSPRSGLSRWAWSTSATS